MISRLSVSQLLPSMIMIGVLLPGRGVAQVVPDQPSTGPGCTDCAGSAGSITYGPGYYGQGPRYGKELTYPPQDSGYPGLTGGPYVTQAYPFVGYPGYRGADGALWAKALHLTGPRVPVYGPIPAVVETHEAVNHHQSRKYIWLGVGYTGWFGTYRASPRPSPPHVSAWPLLGPGPGSVAPSGPAFSAPITQPNAQMPQPVGPSSGCLTLAVKVPASAEVYVDGNRTNQTGSDRLYESPPLAAGKDFSYEVVIRWVERGVTLERKKMISGKSGDVVRLDITTPDVVLTSR